jgi:NADP-dependent 3-hydroxy acid dehydrogenase YdfG
VSERVAIVVGAGGGGLGRATAEKLAAAGFTVAGVDRSEQGLRELPDGIRREAVVPYLRERGSGSVVHMAACPGLEPAAGMAAYARPHRVPRE